MKTCPRCGTELTASIVSMFNLEEICIACKKIEKQHPKYKEAEEAEIEQVMLGNYDFPGIGKPDDL